MAFEDFDGEGGEAVAAGRGGGERARSADEHGNCGAAGLAAGGGGVEVREGGYVGVFERGALVC